MRILLIHAELFTTKTVEKALKEAEEIPSEYSIELKNVLVVFTTIEEGDSRNSIKLATDLVKDLKDLVIKLKPTAIVLYPYAHLSRNLAKPYEALEVFKTLEKALREEIKEIPTYRTPFGWYKQFTINCYGHPLSELSREYKAKEEIKTAELNECFVYSRTSGTQKLIPDSKHVKTMKWVLSKHRCVDVATTRWKPSERINELLSKFKFKLVEDAGLRLHRLGPAIIIEDKLLELSESIINELREPHDLQGEKIITQGYSENTERNEEFLCFTTTEDFKHCVSSEATSNHVKVLMELEVLKERSNYYLYEVASVLKEAKPSDFRNYLTCLRKPQLTVLLSSEKEALNLLKDLLNHILKKLEKTELLNHLIPVLVVSQKVFEEGLPTPINEVLNKFYEELLLVVKKNKSSWELTVELYYVDSTETPTLLTKTSLRIQTHTTTTPRHEHVITLSSELLGPLEVLAYALIDKAYKTELAGKTPYIPAFLAPTQVRIIPVSKNHAEYAEFIASKLRATGISVDVDHREVGLGRKIRDAGISWIPYVVVVGDREKESETVNVRIRSTGLQKSMKIDEFIEFLKISIS
ncbi:MAG: threonyl-tRNA synthetase editing domain-containing protein [Desulfurococcaceae archaeon TW002]